MTPRDDHRHPVPTTAATSESASPEGDYRLLVEQVAHAMLLVDRRGRLVAANRRAEALLNLGRERLLGRHVDDLLLDGSREAMRERLRAAFGSGEAPEDLEATLVHPEGHHALVGVTFLPVRDHHDRLALLLRDLTHERAERDVATAKEAQAYREAAAEHRKLADLGTLISGVNHQLRTPLTYVVNNLVITRQRLEQVLAEHPELAEDVRPLLHQNDVAQVGVERIQRLIEQLRPLTKNRPHRTERLDLAELVMDAVGTFRATHRGRVRVELDLQSTHAIPMDRDEMVHVLTNLLNNAAEAMGEQGVVRVVTRNRDNPPEIRVVDHGPGIPPRVRATLFEPFRTTKPDGTGLGLFISRRTVEAHGGTIEVEETPGGGATFVVRLPVPDEPPPA